MGASPVLDALTDGFGHVLQEVYGSAVEAPLEDWTSDADDILSRLRAAGIELVERDGLARALQETILTSPDEYMGPGMGAYRTPWVDLTERQQRHVLTDADAILAALRAQSEEAD